MGGSPNHPALLARAMVESGRASRRGGGEGGRGARLGALRPRRHCSGRAGEAGRVGEVYIRRVVEYTPGGRGDYAVQLRRAGGWVATGGGA